uniref:Uncharacterized protein n=1 Tax=Arundo donax TaxID=35708 RepID=A0A0A9HAN6_ARUDO
MPFHHSVHWLYIVLTPVLKAPVKTIFVYSHQEWSLF